MKMNLLLCTFVTQIAADEVRSYLTTTGYNVTNCYNLTAVNRVELCRTSAGTSNTSCVSHAWRSHLCISCQVWVDEGALDNVQTLLVDVIQPGITKSIRSLRLEQYIIQTDLSTAAHTAVSTTCHISMQNLSHYSDAA